MQFSAPRAASDGSGIPPLRWSSTHHPSGGVVGGEIEYYGVAGG